MLYVKTDTNKSIYFDFEVDGELVVPDTSSVTITLSKPDGTILSGYDDKAITPPVGDSYVVLDIDAAANAKTLDVEMRHLEINFTHDSKPHSTTITYMIVDRLNFGVVPADVRNLIGISADEWPDENIDLIKAYLDIQEEDALSDIDIDATFESGDTSVRGIIEVIKLKAAINILPALELIAVQSLQADNVSFRRFEKIDFAAIGQRLKAQYSKALLVASGDIDSTGDNLTYAIVSTGTDAVTGE